MSAAWITVFSDPSQAACTERALVLTSLDIPHELIRDDLTYAIAVPVEHAERAKYELWQYEQENRPSKRRPPAALPAGLDPLPGILFYVGGIGLFAWLANEGAFGQDWLARGRMDGHALRDGEWWRSFTALTLHLNLRHLVGNMGFGALFGYFAGRVAGSGVGWLTIVLSAALGNVVNTLLLDPSHRSIGASTAVFAALGLTAGFVWRGRLMAQDRWPYRWGPIVGGIALLAFTGTGTENTDVGAHLLGFVCGFLAGIALVRAAPALGDRRLQRLSAAFAVALIVGGWMFAFA